MSSDPEVASDRSGAAESVRGAGSDGGAAVLADDASRIVYSTDNSVYQVVPESIALPNEIDHIAKLLADNAAAPEPKPIVARGGGTGTNGQSLTDGLMVDLKRSLDRIISIDVDARRAVVEPGVVTGRLNAELAQHGLHWAPHTSTLNRATVGGMISTDAAGKGSLVHGRAHRHVEELAVLLADGTRWTATPLAVEEAGRRAERDPVWRALLDLPIAEGSRFDLPELARGWSGYGIDRLRRDGLIDPTALFCGAEGTLGIIASATLRLTPLPERPRLAVAIYPTFDDALVDSVRLRETGPTAIEAFDETTLERGRGSPAWPALGSIVGDRTCAVLLLEYADAPPVEELRSQILAGERCVEVQITDDAGDQAAMWKVRADAVGLLAKVAIGVPERSARPTAFVEDCAVPVAEMPTFISSFRQLLDDAGVTYGMFGHADVGCVHVRPALDLAHADDRDRHAQLSRDVAELVHAHGGILWGEHGRGFRGETCRDVLDARTIELMRRVKTIFDPQDLLNPGKLYRPLGIDAPIVALDEAPLRGSRDEAVPVELRRAHDHAFACNGNGLCQQWDSRQAMCPSYLATGDPALSPKGRADLVREWLANRRGDRNFEAALRENLNQCLSCGACTGQCPVEVDIGELKSRVLHSIGKTTLSHRILSRFEEAARFASLTPGLARMLLPLARRMTGLVDLPAPSERRRPQRRFRKGGRSWVVVLPDVFTSALEPSTLDHAMQVFESIGVESSVAPFVSSGKFDHVKGRRRRFARIVRRQQIQLRQVRWGAGTPVVIEPAIALLHRHEYPATVDDYPGELVRTLPEVLLEQLDELTPCGEGRRVRLLGHCTERTNAPEQLDAWATILGSVGYEVEIPALGCCGMAGIFGHEPANQEISRTLWHAGWSEATATIDEADDVLVVATGYSCRSQGKRFGAELLHPVHLLAAPRKHASEI